LTTSPEVPDDLSDEARDLFLDVTEADPDLSADRFHALVQACRLVTLADRMEAALGADFVVVGYKGQPVPNGLVTEIRLARAAAVAALKAAGLQPPASSKSAAGAALVAHRWAARR
jgi:hypothetical protein